MTAVFKARAIHERRDAIKMDTYEHETQTTPMAAPLPHVQNKKRTLRA